jgi:protein TonB
VQKTDEKLNISKQSRALLASVLLHGLVLLGLGAGTLPSAAPGPGGLVVYLAMPSNVPEQVLVTASISKKKTDTETMQVRSISQVQKKSKEVIPQPVVDQPVPEEKPVAEPVHLEKVQVSDQPQVIPEVVEAVVSLEPTESALEDLPTTENSEIESFTQNPKLKTQNYAKAMLAFAGDPASLGMLARGALGPDLTEAEALVLPEPVYPVLSRKRGEEGRVVIELEISAKGKVLKAEVANSSSYPKLDRAALEAVKNAAFTPATEFGVKVESTTKVAYRFELKGQ